MARADRSRSSARAPSSPTRICAYLPVAEPGHAADPAEILVLDPDPEERRAGGDGMSFDLFNLLPAVYRMRDIATRAVADAAHAGGEVSSSTRSSWSPSADPRSATAPRRADRRRCRVARSHSLLLVIQEQLAILAEDLDQLYDDQFIETCAQWVIPYIGDLIGYQAVKGIAPAIDNPRAEVAHTISLPSPQGHRAGDGAARARRHRLGCARGRVLPLLADTQYMNHIRRWNHYAPDLRRWKPGVYIDTGFDRTAHKVDVRRIAVEPRPLQHPEHRHLPVVAECV